jgi:DNA-binding XRE family transcriptional regulator
MRHVDEFDCVCSCGQCGPLNLHDCETAACTGLWKPIKDWEGLYEVSNRGQVRSLPRPTARGIRGGRIVGQYIRPDGYAEAQLMDRGHGRRLKRMVHHLVLEAFIGSCPEGMEALHGPGGKGDASLKNLAWGTRAKNMGEDRVRDHQSNRGERHGLTTITWADVLEIKRLLAEKKLYQYEIAQQFGVSKQTITNIKTGHTWAHPPEEW